MLIGVILKSKYNGMYFRDVVHLIYKETTCIMLACQVYQPYPLMDCQVSTELVIHLSTGGIPALTTVVVPALVKSGSWWSLKF